MPIHFKGNYTILSRTKTMEEEKLTDINKKKEENEPARKKQAKRSSYYNDLIKNKERN